MSDILDPTIPHYIDSFRHMDPRGAFHKIYPPKGLDMEIKEVFYSFSKKGVIRGMHYQTAPYELKKIIKVVKGEILDVLIDYRPDSKTYGEVHSFKLNEDNGCVYVPVGFAHGFQALTDDSVTLYLQDLPFSSEGDTGIRINSFGFDWPIKEYELSERDSQLPKFNLNP